MRVRRGFNARELLSSFTSESRTYQYRPLPSPRSIRLLEVRPASSSPDSGGKIAISLSTHSVDDAPPFQALSYTWGYPLIPESRPSRSGTWRRLAFLQRVQARTLLENDGRAGSGTGTGSSAPLSAGSSSTGLSSLLRIKLTQNMPCFPVKCDGRNLRVTANLHDALAMLARTHQHVHAEFPRQRNFYWVDAL
jgi:hypothetical protein